MRIQCPPIKHYVTDPFRRVGVTGCVFACDVPSDQRSPQALLETLGHPAEDEESAKRRLLELIEARAASLEEVPSAAVVVDASEPGDRECRDLLTFLTIAAKSSSTVYLRGKSPILENGVTRDRIVLLIPTSKG